MNHREHLYKSRVNALLLAIIIGLGCGAIAAYDQNKKDKLRAEQAKQLAEQQQPQVPEKPLPPRQKDIAKVSTIVRRPPTFETIVEGWGIVEVEPCFLAGRFSTRGLSDKLSLLFVKVRLPDGRQVGAYGNPIALANNYGTPDETEWIKEGDSVWLLSAPFEVLGPVDKKTGGSRLLSAPGERIYFITGSRRTWPSPFKEY